MPKDKNLGKMKKEGKMDNKAGDRKNLLKTNRAQVTIFIIIAIIIVLGIAVYFILRSPYRQEIPKNMQPVYDYYLSCIESNAQQGIALLGEQGGWINTDELGFIPGSQHMPFSSQLDFFGQAVPYWMYVSGNNLLKEQVPSKSKMEEQLADYIGKRADYCDFSDFAKQGFEVVVDNDGISDVSINDLNVDINLKNKIFIYFENESVEVQSHKISVESKLGKFYSLALNAYNFEKSQMFLEKYALDVLRLYAPVDGVELSCSPKTFVKSEIRSALADALEANIGVLKLKGSYYELAGKESNYFVSDIGESVDENVNFIYSSSWPARIEISPEDDPLVITPVGLQEGMGILGFCYIPYHLVYDVNFPVLIQFYDEKEIFQFPVSVIIDKNQAREALPTATGVSIEPEVCRYKNQDVSVRTYDSKLNPVEARIRFKCLTTACDIGETSMQGAEAVLNARFPQCVNGFILASAEGYAETKYQISTNEESSADIILNKIYNIKLDLGNVEKALVVFDSPDYSKSILYPDMNSAELIEGYYNISVYAYKNSTLKIPSTTRRQCVNVPKSGVAGVFGIEEEKCFNIETPETEVSFAVVGGGKTADYFTESQLGDARELNINVPLFKTPQSLDDIQNNYAEVENAVLGVNFE